MKIVKLNEHYSSCIFLKYNKNIFAFLLILKQKIILSPKKNLKDAFASFETFCCTFNIRLVRPSICYSEMKLMSCSKPTKAAYCGWKWNGWWVSAKFNKSISSPSAKFRRIISAMEFCHHNYASSYASSSSRLYLGSSKTSIWRKKKTHV